MRQINLLPPELAVKRKARQILGVLAAVGAGLVVLIAVVYIAQQARLSGERDKLAQQQQRNSIVRTEVASLQRFELQQAELTTKQALLTAITRNDVLWSGILTELSLVIPTDDWLTNFTGQVSQAAPTAQRGAVAAIGSIQVAGCTLIPPEGDHLNVAQFLVQIAKPLSFADDPFVTLTSKGEPATCPISFNALIQLTDQARRSAQKGKERKV